MALSTTPPAAPGWNRWTTQPPSPEYGLIDGTAVVQYDARATTPAAMQRPVDASHYLVGNTYTMAPPMAMPAPHYQGHPQYGFVCCVTPPSPASLLPSFRRYQDDWPRMMCMDAEDNDASMNYMRDTRHQSYIQDQLHASNTITPIIAADPEKQTVFHTDVDTLMKTIQVQDEAAQTPAPVERVEARYPSPPHHESKIKSCSPGTSPEATGTGSRTSRGRHMCSLPQCNKRFAQKSHLGIHERSHSGEKPYVTLQTTGCGQRFSQLGNVKTHECRHTDETPYRCEICGKAFAQRGNVRAHKEVHNNFKRFSCRLDGCQKKFSQLGNMKTHQNKFHAETIKTLTAKFAGILQAGGELQGDDKELFEHFAIHYKNSNKGIKGRGKDRKVNTVTSAPAVPSRHYPVPQAPHHSMAHGLPYPAVGSSSAFGHYGTYNMLMARDARRGYEGYDMDHDSVSASSTTGTLSDEGHHFADRYQERLY
ncbi:uncharacterized protein B0I36DRAFT_368731 [Microdochium trichocladiopsis]|uniref:C2H2-type domain-containing protein n=1 Tax=Microdochium trichocladiopsis TaxID=1682393 RepID=A0A9P8XVY0_9PEZI|nr:uncharacterized protein B0I36DRAFT_368731 [Microdochium trichocladiopsis]KAH7016115.1 hypothetical protein B0I36DRAFT_368731 [Microdochium trichocladiopsis]